MLPSHHLVIGSLNPQKIEAIQHAFHQEYKDCLYTIAPVKATSGVSEQPIGLQEATQGALNRMFYCLAEINASKISEIYYAIGIENGLISGEELDENYSKNHWHDVSIVAIRVFKQGCTFSSAAMGEPLQIPNECGNGMPSPLAKGTIGEKLKNYQQIILPIIGNSQDLYAHFSNNETTRSFEIQKTAENCFKKLKTT